MAPARPIEIKTATRIVRRESSGPREVSADICVVGAGSAGISAALEAAALGRRVVLVDGLHALGGQAVNSVIGTFCGFFSNGYSGYQTVHGIADGILHNLGATARCTTGTAGRRTPSWCNTTRWRWRA